MESEKLKLLLNKVVEYNKPNAAHYRGFLYKSSGDYFIKVIEVDNGDVDVNDREYLSVDDEKFVTQSDKPKLMRVSLKSWHYRLIKYVLRSNAPTPKTMQNGCPYFWLLVFSIFASPFVFVAKTAWFLFLLIPKTMIWGLDKLVGGWVDGIDDAQAYEYYLNGRYNVNEFIMPITAKIYFDKTNTDFMEYFINKKHKISRDKNYDAYEAKRQELKEKWDAWCQEINELHEKRREEKRIEGEEQERRRLEFEEKRRIREEQWEVRLKPIREGWQKFLATFTFDSKNWKLLIKRTKQFIGAIITIILLCVTFFVVQGLAYVLTGFVDWSIANWEVYASIGIIIGIVVVINGIIYILFTGFAGWIQAIVNNYHAGKKVWYIEPFIYLICYPVKYIVLFLAFGLRYVIVIPIKYIFYNLIWKIILVNLGILIWNGLCSLGRGIANCAGIFGEYFSASYSDYCPGIEWVDTDEE